MNSLICNAFHISTDKIFPTGYFKTYLRPYRAKHNLKYYHSKQKQSRNDWIKSNKENTELFSVYKNEKREFRKRKRRAEMDWRNEVNEELKHAAELDMGEFYRLVRKRKNNIGCINIK